MNLNLIGTLALVLATASTAFAAPRCDEQTLFTSSSGQSLIDCRIDAEAARSLYDRVQATDSERGDPVWSTYLF